jgi:hypothetical protein
MIDAPPDNSGVPNSGAPNYGPGAPAPGSSDTVGEVFGGKRDLLAERLTLMLIDLGGLTYEMGIRDHFRLDVLVRKAAEIQAIDAELGQVDRLLSLGRAGAAGDCPNCGALFARGSAFCSHCGYELAVAGPVNSAPHVAQPHESLPAPPGLLKQETP